jgi:hypothetical protein
MAFFDGRADHMNLKDEIGIAGREHHLEPAPVFQCRVEPIVCSGNCCADLPVPERLPHPEVKSGTVEVLAFSAQVGNENALASSDLGWEWRSAQLIASERG